MRLLLRQYPKILVGNAEDFKESLTILQLLQ